MATANLSTLERLGAIWKRSAPYNRVKCLNLTFNMSLLDLGPILDDLVNGLK